MHGHVGELATVVREGATDERKAHFLDLRISKLMFYLYVDTERWDVPVIVFNAWVGHIRETDNLSVAVRESAHVEKVTTLERHRNLEELFLLKVIKIELSREVLDKKRTLV